MPWQHIERKKMRKWAKTVIVIVDDLAFVVVLTRLLSIVAGSVVVSFYILIDDIDCCFQNLIDLLFRQVVGWLWRTICNTILIGVR